jgi:hypothetical protein
LIPELPIRFFLNLSTSSPSGPALTGAAGQPISCWGDKFFHLSFGGQKFIWPFLQAAVQFPIIGADLLRHFGLLVDPATNQLVDCHTLHRFQSSTEAPYWPVSASTLLPSARQLEEPFPSSPHRPLHLHGLSWGSLASPGSSPASTPSPSPVVSTVSHVKTSSRSCEAVSQAATCGPSSEAGRDWVAGLLRDFPDVVNTAKWLPAVRHDVVHHIQTYGPPIASRFLRLEGAKLEAARQEFEAMERDGAIERSTSPWASPQHLLLKKDGMWRPCGDFRWLNLVTKPDIYPFPQHAGFLRPPEWLCVFSKINLRKGYWQVRVRLEDRKKTAVITPFGLPLSIQTDAFWPPQCRKQFSAHNGSSPGWPSFHILLPGRSAHSQPGPRDSQETLEVGFRAAAAVWFSYQPGKVCLCSVVL